MALWVNLGKDKQGQFKIDWSQGSGRKRAWVQRGRPAEKDWAGTERYIQVVRLKEDGNPGGNPTDFPVFRSDISDRELLIAFVTNVCALVGNRLPDPSDWEMEHEWSKE